MNALWATLLCGIVVGPICYASTGAAISPIGPSSHITEAETEHMPGVFVGTYSIHVHPKGDSTPSPLKFSDTDSAYATVFAALKTLQTCHDDKTQEKLLRVTTLEGDGTDIWGFIERGDYGYSASIVSQKTLKPSYQKKKDEAEMRPFYFRFHLPDTADTGILVLQRLGIHGVFTDLRLALENSFRVKHENFRLRMARRVRASEVHSMLAGKVRSYKVTTYTVPSDLADFVKYKGAKKHEGSFEIVIKAARGKSLWGDGEPTWYKSIIQGHKTVADIWPDGNVHEVTVSVQDKGRWRQVDLSDPDEIMPYQEITDDVKMNDGHPDLDSMNKKCIEIRDDLLTEISIKS